MTKKAKLTNYDFSSRDTVELAALRDRLKGHGIALFDTDIDEITTELARRTAGPFPLVPPTHAQEIN